MKSAVRTDFLGIGFILATLLAFALDQPIARAMAGMNPFVLRIARFVTWFGQGGVILYPAGITILAGLSIRYLIPDLDKHLDNPIKKTASTFIVVAAAGLSDDVLKIVFGRARPYLWLAGDQSGFHFFRIGARFASFPSGHTTTSVAAALVFSAIFPRLCPAFWGAAVLIGLTRVLLDLHYLSDVFAGASLAWIITPPLIVKLRNCGWLPTSNRTHAEET